MGLHHGLQTSCHGIEVSNQLSDFILPPRFGRTCAGAQISSCQFLRGRAQFYHRPSHITGQGKTNQAGRDYCNENPQARHITSAEKRGRRRRQGHHQREPVAAHNRRGLTKKPFRSDPKKTWRRRGASVLEILYKVRRTASGNFFSFFIEQKSSHMLRSLQISQITSYGLWALGFICIERLLQNLGFQSIPRGGFTKRTEPEGNSNCQHNKQGLSDPEGKENFEKQTSHRAMLPTLAGGRVKI